MAEESTRVTVVSQNSLMRMLREQGVTDLDDLVTKGLETAQGAVKEGADDSGCVFMCEHYVFNWSPTPSRGGSTPSFGGGTG
jgi:hypothetical protein